MDGQTQVHSIYHAGTAWHGKKLVKFSVLWASQSSTPNFPPLVQHVTSAGRKTSKSLVTELNTGACTMHTAAGKKFFVFNVNAVISAAAVVTHQLVEKKSACVKTMTDC